MKGCFVTGTDTGVGKTTAAVALVRELRRHHARVVGMKPVAAGGDEDISALRVASNVRVPAELDNPVALAAPLSPHIAARHDGLRIDIADITRRYRELAAQVDFVVVEGAGGFHVPLTDTETGADLASALCLPVVLVVGLRLGCLNHALLTAEAIRARNLRLAGWIANRVDPAMQAQDDNIAYLTAHLNAPLLADIPYGMDHGPRAIRFDLPPEWTATR